MQPKFYHDLVSWEDTQPDPVGFFVDTEDAVKALVDSLYDCDHLDKQTLHNAVWYLASSWGPQKVADRFDLYQSEDLCIEHWREIEFPKLTIKGE